MRQQAPASGSVRGGGRTHRGTFARTDLSLRRERRASSLLGQCEHRVSRGDGGDLFVRRARPDTVEEHTDLDLPAP